MDPSSVCRSAHQSIQGVDFPHQVAFADSADGWVAGHLTHSRQRMGQQQRPRARSGSRPGGLAPGVSGADNDDIVLVVHDALSAMKTPSFAMPNTTPFAAAAAGP
jgi:hypothetical protein